MKLWKIILLMSIATILYLSLLLISVFSIHKVEVDAIAINDIVNKCAANWKSADFSFANTYQMEFTILDNLENVLYQTIHSKIKSINDGIKSSAIMVDVHNANNSILGKVIFDDQSLLLIEHAKNNFIFYAVFFTFSMSILLVIYLIYINQKILKPFLMLKTFSANIARGNFDSPLLMDKQNAFGAFTESFDIMRDELLNARENERLANQSKKELVASLSHDIKTPVASIIAATEVLILKSNSKEEQDRLKTILIKAEQINALISDMFHATLEDLQTLSISPIDVYSKDLIEMIQNADYEKHVILLEIPECVLLCDPLRLQQVFDNIIVNSYKYAGTEINVSCVIKDNKLEITFTDFGNGIPEDELYLIFDKYYRGKNSERKHGAGLGLYISHFIITNMGGEIYAESLDNGFKIVLSVKLA